MYCVDSIIALLLMIVCCAAIKLGGGNNGGPSVARPDATIQQVCCSKNWSLCCSPHGWSIEGSYDQIMKAICKKYFKEFPEYGAFGPECVNEYQLFADMKVARNQIYEYHTCYTGNKDYYFINKTIKTINDLDSAQPSCCKKHLDADGLNINVALKIVWLDRQVVWPADRVYERYIKKEESPPCENYGDEKIILFQLQAALRRLEKYRECAKYIACPTNDKF